MFIHNNIKHMDEDTQEMPQLCNIHKKITRNIQKKSENGGRPSLTIGSHSHFWSSTSPCLDLREKSGPSLTPGATFDKKNVVHRNLFFHSAVILPCILNSI